MKKLMHFFIAIAVLSGLLALPLLEQRAQASWQAEPLSQEDRPMLYIANYHTDTGGKNVSPWGKFGLTFTIGNNGLKHARNIVMTFNSSVFDSLDGGVFNVYEVDAKNAANETHTHHFRVNDMSTWMYSGVITAHTTYTDPEGNAYSDTFTFSITIDQAPSTSSTSATPTVAAIQRPQMVVTSYQTDMDPLQPGTAFKLTLNVANAGLAEAKRVSLVYGGGASTSTNPMGTPEYGGVPGGSSDLTNFAPLGQSNVVMLGDIPSGTSLQPTQDFVVNVNTAPGAYPLKLSFVYSDSKGIPIVDDQVITLLVYSLPQLEISFYQDPGYISAGMMIPLPIQITNLSRKTQVLGNVIATSDAGELTENSILVGTLDPGGYFSFDPMFMPFAEGPAVINFEIRYTDDFNQLRTYNASLDLEVMPAFEEPELLPMLDENGNPVLDEFGNPVYYDPMYPPMPGPEGNQSELGFFARIWNAIKGFFGFGTGDKNNSQMPVEEKPAEVPIYNGKGL